MQWEFFQAFDSIPPKKTEVFGNVSSNLFAWAIDSDYFLFTPASVHAHQLHLDTSDKNYYNKQKEKL